MQCRDAIGFCPGDYDRLFERAHVACISSNAAESAQRQTERQNLLQACERITDQVQNCIDMHKKALIGDPCFQTVHQGLTSELRVKQHKLAIIEQAIATSTNPVGQYKEALMMVLKLVAEGCSRKRPRVE